MADGANTFRVQAGENGVRLTPRQILQTRCCILVISCRSEQWSKQSPWNTPSKTGAYISNIWEWRWAHSSTLKMSLQPAEMRTEMSHAVILHIVLVRDLSIFCTHTHFLYGFCILFLTNWVQVEWPLCSSDTKEMGVGSVLQSQWKGVASEPVSPIEGVLKEPLCMTDTMNEARPRHLRLDEGGVVFVWCYSKRHDLCSGQSKWKVWPLAVSPSEGGVSLVPTSPSERGMASVSQFQWRRSGLCSGHYQWKRCGLCSS